MNILPPGLIKNVHLVRCQGLVKKAHRILGGGGLKVVIFLATFTILLSHEFFKIREHFSFNIGLVLTKKPTRSCKIDTQYQQGFIENQNQKH